MERLFDELIMDMLILRVRKIYVNLKVIFLLVVRKRVK